MALFALSQDRRAPKLPLDLSRSPHGFSEAIQPRKQLFPRRLLMIVKIGEFVDSSAKSCRSDSARTCSTNSKLLLTASALLIVLRQSSIADRPGYRPVPARVSKLGSSSAMRSDAVSRMRPAVLPNPVRLGRIVQAQLSSGFQVGSIDHLAFAKRHRSPLGRFRQEFNCGYCIDGTTLVNQADLANYEQPGDHECGLIIWPAIWTFFVSLDQVLKKNGVARGCG